MVDFSLSEEQRMLQEAAREFAAAEVQPHAEKWDRESTFPREAIRKANELGLLTVKIPEEYGGYGMGSFEEVLICEEIGWGDPGFATASGSTMLASYPLITGGTEDQKQRYLSKVADGCIAAYCVTEPGAGSDVQSIRTQAVRDGDDYVVTGSKMWITGAGHADWFFVLAYTDREAGYRGMSGFIVDADSAGVVLGKKEENMGQRCSDTRAVDFNDVRVPAENLIGGEENGGWMNAMRAFDLSRPTISAHAVGNARGAMEEALRYANERSTFGKPIYRHQAISFMIADMATKIEAARLLTWCAAKKADAGERNTLEAAHAKRFSADMAMEVTTDAVQVFGGYGYSEEYPVARRMRGAKVVQIFEGSSQIQRMIIGRELLRGM
ncbi:MAG: acyl-CoA dehydrogenase [Candidatus Thalassarchaeum betae]|uniref:Acyl-CoA dehydrogenase n=1 Tax=Candidatus Thalassarchaeum betae TaxID=2599289 RepID=A0A2V3HSP8_9ARCH|nr:MAG: acyl-CoA dehydrogenase [Candidatus Thalassoarchaea betae]PXF27059.1 MAG: acyl-CoA dehydrogenase [Euryarchaeota archaeon]HIC50880.1 acyl-CoA dehydrogenase [Candidatus Poseidoniales archaeon]HIM13397.1 acyl-CoA dehydrogenase [Candidatus Poseidoniales archaeon]HIM92654.1 acyl-CoA dehydrogenase [Candidatus Poseidoniales archaeon]